MRVVRQNFAIAILYNMLAIPLALAGRGHLVSVELDIADSVSEEAVALFKPDLVVLDAMMPKVSGFDVLDILRNTPETANVKIIMLTALSQDSDKERAQGLGVDDYLVKSQVVISDVVDRIKHHLGMDL